MSTTYKKFFASLLALTSCAAFVNASDACHQEKDCAETSACCQEKLIQDIAILPCARTQVQCGWDLFVEAELLWWSAYENGLAYAIKTDKVINHARRSYVDMEEISISHSYDKGFRFGVGYNLPFDCWDLKASWAFFNNEARSHTKNPNNGYLMPLLLNTDTENDQGMSKGSAHWMLEMNMIDLELGSNFLVRNHLSIRPHMGFRYLRLDQKYKVHYNLEGAWFGNFSSSEKFQAIYNNDFWGFGPRGGLDTEWSLGCGFSLFSNIAFSFLNGHFHVQRQEKDVDTYTFFGTSSSDNKGNNIQTRIRVGRIVTDFSIGAKWDKSFENDRFHLGLKLGWEHHIFFGQNQMRHLSWSSGTPTLRHSNDELTTQGWTLTARFDF